MKARVPYALPADRRALLRRAARLEWLTIFFLATIAAAMYATMGSSQAMKAAWIEDVLSLVPPITFLWALRWRDRPPDAEYPYGHGRATLLSFLAASVAVLVLGLYLLVDSAGKLISAHHPTIGVVVVLGRPIWAGWTMIAALAYSMVPPVVLGRLKLPLSRALHEKTLHADADMNRADWMTAGAAILGILGVGLGLWWADAAAAGFISLAVLKDGVANLRNAMADLMDRRPSVPGSREPLGLEERIRDELVALPGVGAVEVRLREEGCAVTGEVFVELDGGETTARRCEELAGRAAALDWKLHDLVVTPRPRSRPDAFTG